MSGALFYRTFEERFYAPRDVIKGLRRQYAGFYEPLTSLFPASATFDIGCGRGEWLELMVEQGFAPLGVDLDDGMLQACSERSLPAEKGDAIARLAALPDASQALVTAFHVVEHITFDQLKTVIEQAHRVLKPGGLLILETPNPENVVVGTHLFYLDPTHIRPIPPAFLAFLPEYFGFARTCTLRLQEAQRLRGEGPVSLMDVFSGVSPDYAIVAQRQGDAGVMGHLDKAFATESGLQLYQLADRYQASVQQQINQLAQRQDAVEIRATQAEARANDLTHSLSWRVTAPLRMGMDLVRSPMAFAMGQVLKRPALSARFNTLIRRVPFLHRRLRNSAISTGLVVGTLETAIGPSPPKTPADLSPRARVIHDELQQKTREAREKPDAYSD